MSIQMTLVFSSLCLEMGFLLLLVLPLPHIIRTQIVDIVFLLEKSTYFKTGVGFWTMLMSMQVADCVQKLNKFTGNHGENPYYAQNHHQNVPLTHEQLASKFYAQRNLYISGAVLYLMISIYTVVSIVKKLVLKEKAVREFKPVNNDDEVVKYKELLIVKQQDIDTLKKQVNGLQLSYDTLTEDSVKPGEKKDL